jgi:hypothetical protein
VPDPPPPKTNDWAAQHKLLGKYVTPLLWRPRLQAQSLAFPGPRDGVSRGRGRSNRCDFRRLRR